ncbi:MAG: LPS assembly protein LptD [Pseudomonadota bacterium]
MTLRQTTLALSCALFLSAAPGAAQTTPDGPPATLIADGIRFDQNENTVTAEGNVEVFYEGSRLRARSVAYDGDTDRIIVGGPLTLIQQDGQSIIFAEFADLSTDMQDGVLRGARLVLNRQLQIAANEMERVEGRYNQAYQVIASSCEICDESQTPIWEIRARRVIHDENAQMLFFENATLRAFGIPIAYVPRLRVPDPTLDRATGFLTPSYLLNGELGFQVQVPYFIRIGDHRDLTITPWIGTNETRTVQLRYRQAFQTGDIQLEGAISDDELTEDDVRGFVFLNGTFDLPRDYVLDFVVEAVSDRGYFTTYGFPDRDLLESFVRISRTQRDQFVELRASNFASLQDGDINDELPTQFVDGNLVYRFAPDVVGGIATASLRASGFARVSDFDGPTGQDVARLTGSLNWRRDTILPGGVLAAFEGTVFGDVYDTRQGAELTGTETRIAPFASAELRYPLARTTEAGVTHLIEPVAQFVWSDSFGGDVPIEDSTIVEFDEANLISLNRFPGQDQREIGSRVNLAVGYTRTDPLGWTLGVTAGVVFRQSDPDQFTEGSGLSGDQSDFLLATHLTGLDNWKVINRAIFDDDLSFTSNEFALEWFGEALGVITKFTFLEADVFEDRPIDTAEWAFDANYAFTEEWAAGVNWRYDFVEDDATRAGLAINYATECIDVGFSVSRRFTTSTTVNPTTEFGLTLALNGLGTSRQGRSHDRSCQR